MNLLEDHVGVRLFNRSHRGLSLTEAGEVFYKDAKHIIQYSENTIKRVTEIDKGVSDTIRIGSSPYYACSIFNWYGAGITRSEGAISDCTL